LLVPDCDLPNDNSEGRGHLVPFLRKPGRSQERDGEAK
jgi:hypothetical protein